MIRHLAKLSLIALCLTACRASNDVGSLETIQSDITQAFPSIAHIKAADLEQRLASSDSGLLILDTRPAAEYNVSHINGAVQVEPDISAKDFKTRFGNKAKDKTVIVYCSVGWRSTIAANALSDAIGAAGGREVLNLQGGLFGWHNQERPLVNAEGATPLIHPYDEKWGALVSRKGTLSYTPK